MTEGYRVTVSRQALTDIDRLEFWLLDKDPNAALEVARRVREAIRSLAEFPERGAPGAHSTRDLYVRFGTAGYRIRYTIEIGQVLVTRIWHSREALPES